MERYPEQPTCLLSSNKQFTVLQGWALSVLSISLGNVMDMEEPIQEQVIIDKEPCRLLRPPLAPPKKKFTKRIVVRPKKPLNDVNYVAWSGMIESDGEVILLSCWISRDEYKKLWIKMSRKTCKNSLEKLQENAEAPRSARRGEGPANT